MRKNFSFMFKIFFCIVCALQSSLAVALTVSDIPLNQATLISSNDDYGLELDWVRQIETGAYCNIIGLQSNKDGEIFICGEFSGKITFDDKFSYYFESDNKRHFFVAKLTEDNKFVWVKLIDNKRVEFNNFELLSDGSLLIVSCIDASDLIYDGKLIHKYDKDDSYIIRWDFSSQVAAMRIDAESGDMMNCFVSRGGFDLEDPSSELAITTPDGGFIISVYMPEGFEGLNSLYPTSCKCTGKYNRYYAKFDSDFKLIWDFAVSDKTLFDKYARNYNTDEYMFLKDDTLYINLHYYDDLQISPDPQNPVVAKYPGNYFDKLDKIGGCVLARYLIKDNGVELINFKSYLDIDTRGFSMDKDEIVYMSYSYSDGYLVRLNDDLSYDTVFAKPFSKDGFGSFSIYHYSGNESDMGIYDKNRCLHFSFQSYEDTVLYANDTVRINLDYSNNANTRGFFVYDIDKNFRYAFLLKVRMFARKFNNLEGVYCKNYDKGFLTFTIQTKDGESDNKTNMSLKVGEDAYLKNYNGVNGLVKYTETFRIREEASGNGHILQAGEMVRHGSDVSITAQPKEGYKVDSILTSRGDKLAQQVNGTFLLPNVTDAVTLRAFYSQTDGVADYLTDGFSVYPNPATDVITVSGLGSFDFFISDLSGRTLSSGRAEGGSVSVSALPSGSYILKINKDKAIKFEKK